MAASVISVLKELAADLPHIKPISRCKIPHNSILQRIIVFSDASLDVVAFAIYLEVRHPDLSIRCDFLFANAYTRHTSIPSLEMLALVIGLSELHTLISKHSISLLPASMVRVDFLLDSECTLHSLNINKLSKSILIKNAKDKMTCHLAQISKGYNVTIRIGYTPTDKQTTDLATKYYEGLITNINSSKWRHGDESKLVPLLNDKTTFLTAPDVKCTVNNCHEFCRHTSDMIFETFCDCETCDIAFWKPYEYLFSNEGISEVDLDIHEVKTCSGERKQKDATFCSSISDSVNIFPLTGQKMNNFLPQIFNMFALHAFQATEHKQ